MIYVDVRYPAVLLFSLLFGLFHAGFSPGVPGGTGARQGWGFFRGRDGGSQVEKLRHSFI